MPHDPKMVEAVRVALDKQPYHYLKPQAALDAIEAAGCVVVPVERLEFCITAIAKLQPHRARFALEHMVAARPGAQP